MNAASVSAAKPGQALPPNLLLVWFRPLGLPPPGDLTSVVCSARFRRRQRVGAGEAGDVRQWVVRVREGEVPVHG